MATKYKLHCNLDLGAVIGHTVIWILLIIVTLGLAGPFYLYFVLRKVVNSTTVEEV